MSVQLEGGCFHSLDPPPCCMLLILYIEVSFYSFYHVHSMDVHAWAVVAARQSSPAAPARDEQVLDTHLRKPQRVRVYRPALLTIFLLIRLMRPPEARSIAAVRFSAALIGFGGEKGGGRSTPSSSLSAADWLRTLPLPSLPEPLTLASWDMRTSRRRLDSSSDTVRVVETRGPAAAGSRLVTYGFSAAFMTRRMGVPPNSNSFLMELTRKRA